MASASCAPASPALAESSSRRRASGLRVSAAGDSGEDFTTAWERLSCPAGGGETAGAGAGFKVNGGGEVCGGGLEGTAAARNCSAVGAVKARGTGCPAFGGGEASVAEEEVDGAGASGPVFSRAALSCVCVCGRAGTRFCPRSTLTGGRGGRAACGGGESLASSVLVNFSSGGGVSAALAAGCELVARAVLVPETVLGAGRDEVATGEIGRAH